MSKYQTTMTSTTYVDLEKHVPLYPSAPYKRLEHPADKSLLSSFFIGIFFLVFALALFCPVMGLVVVLLPICVVIRRCFDCCACRCSQNRNHEATCCANIVSNTDTFWLTETPANRMVTQCLITMEQGLDMSRIRDLINARLISAECKSGHKMYPKFSEKIIELTCGYAWVTDPDFNINNHFVAMPKNIQFRRDLEEYISVQATKPLPLNRPLWDVHILTDYGESKDTVLLLRIHPSLTDGVSLVRILLRSVVDDSNLLCNFKTHFASRVLVFNIIRAVIVGPLVFLQKWLFTRTDYNIFHGPRLSGKKVISWSEPFSMAQATRIKQVTRSTLNDVLMSVAAGTMRTYQQLRGIENPYDLLATLTVDLRSDASSVDMAAKYSLLQIVLPTNTEGAIPRLWELKHRMEDLKNSADPPLLFGAVGILSYLLPECISHMILNSINNHSSCIISNLEGPSIEQTFASREIKEVMFWVPPRDEIGLSISFLTYSDQVRMAVIADRAVLSNPHILTRDFIFQMNRLSHLLANRRIPGEHPSRRLEPYHDSIPSQSDCTVEELQRKMSLVQSQLQDMKSKYDNIDDDGSTFVSDEQQLADQIEQLRDEFKDLLIELRRRKASDGSALLSEDEDSEDGELRRGSMRRRTLSTASRRISIVSHTSVTRPLTTASQSRGSTSHSPPSSPTTLASKSSETDRDQSNTNSEYPQVKQTVAHDQVSVFQESPPESYSPQVEHKFASKTSVNV
ncbi:uncharacterized protein LOC141915117 [Tubulanus polymorphus]|uniref:uncharacterized protein LOC141915117 n=1 Tax=Tubulanus polymorphus TaxID=672921 RepID=UPI003DA4B740